MIFPANTRYIFKVETVHGTVIVPSTVDHIHYINKFFKFSSISLLANNIKEYSWVDIDIESLFKSKRFHIVDSQRYTFILSDSYKKITERWLNNTKIEIILDSDNSIPITKIVSKNDIGRVMFYLLLSGIKLEIDDETCFSNTSKSTLMFKNLIKFIKNISLKEDGSLLYLLKTNDIVFDTINTIDLFKDYSDTNIITDECDYVKINSIYSSLLFLNINVKRIIESDNIIYKQLFGIKVDLPSTIIKRMKPHVSHRYEYYTIDNVNVGIVVYNNNCLLRVIDVKR